MRIYKAAATLFCDLMRRIKQEDPSEIDDEKLIVYAFVSIFLVTLPSLALKEAF